MKTGVLQTCLSKSWGGLEMVALELATRMHQDGIAVTTACAPGSPLAVRLEKAGLSVLPIRRRNKYISPCTILRLRRELKSGRYSAVLVEQMNELWQVVPAMWHLSGLRLVGISHTLIGLPKKDGLHRQLYGRLDSLIALTEIHRRNLLQQLPVREAALEVIPNAVDLRKFSPEKRSETLRREFLGSAEVLIGVVSRVDKGKGLREAIEVAEILHRQGKSFKMILAGRETIGEEGMAAILEREVATRGLTDRLRLVGHRPDIEALMASLDILLMPSPGETFGRILIEAMASGTAIVAASGGGVPDIVRDQENGLLVPFAAAPLAEATLSLIQDPNLRQRLAARGLQDARERYDQKLVDKKIYATLGF